MAEREARAERFREARVAASLRRAERIAAAQARQQAAMKPKAT